MFKFLDYFDYSVPVGDCRLTVPGNKYYLHGYTFAPVSFNEETYKLDGNTDIYTDRRFTTLLGEDFQQYICYRNSHGYQHIEVREN